MKERRRWYFEVMAGWCFHSLIRMLKGSENAYCLWEGASGQGKSLDMQEGEI